MIEDACTTPGDLLPAAARRDPATTQFAKFPAHRVETARESLVAAHRRAVRAADRAHQDCPGAPVLVVLRAYVQSRCRTCGHVWEGTGDCPARASCRANLDCRGYSRRELADLELSVPRLHLAGWEFLAVVEPVYGTRVAHCDVCQADVREEAWDQHDCGPEGQAQFRALVEQRGRGEAVDGAVRVGEGNLVRRSPGAQVLEGELAAYRGGALVCDHCRTRRGRSETFVVRADGTAETPAGTVRQVGRSCLAAFLGGRSPESVVLALSWEDVVARAGEESEGGGWGGGWDRTTDPVDFLTQVSACARVSGFVTRAQAWAQSDGGPQATASLVSYLTGPAPRYAHARAAWSKARARYAPVDEDAVRARATLAWARSLTGASDYEHNLRLVALQPMLDAARNGGVLASAIPAKDRADGREIERRAQTARREPSRHEGSVGARVEAVATVERCISLDRDPDAPAQYGPAHLLAMRDDRGSALSWVTGTRTFEVGARVRIRGTVKRHKEYRGEAVTELTRCTAERVDAQVVAETCVVAKTRKSRKKKAALAVAGVDDADADADAGPGASDPDLAGHLEYPDSVREIRGLSVRERQKQQRRT